MRSASTKTLICALLLALAPAACTLIAEVDRTKIGDGDGDEGTGGEGLGGETATGGEGGDSGTGGSAGGEGGGGGMGGAD